MSSKEEILSKVAQAVSFHHIEHKSTHFSKPVIVDEQISPLDDFIKRWEANMGKLMKSSKETLEEDLIKLLNQLEAKSFFYSGDISFDGVKNRGTCYDKSVEELRTELFNIDVFMLEACCAVRDLGIIGVKSSPTSGRLASLIPDTCIFLLEKEKLVANMLEAVEYMSKDGLATNTLLIAGPSRTADIELQTVFGVHGPRETWVVLF